MPSTPNLDISANYSSGAPAATDRVNATQLDSDHLAVENWANNELLPKLAEVIRDDDTLVDGIVRSRNLHPEVSLLIASKAGWQPKADVQAASLSNIVLTAPGATIDGRAMVSGDRFLAKNQTVSSENGIYVWNGAAVAATRATDADTNIELGYAFISVAMDGGTTQVGTSWVCNQSVSDISSIDVTSITFSQVGANLIGNAMRPVNAAATLAAARAAMGPWGDALVTATGSATARDLAHRAADIINVKDFGATGDGVTDDTAAMQLAHNTGKVVHYPAGVYKFSKITMTNGGIIGQGPGFTTSATGSTILVSTNADTSDLITFTGAPAQGHSPTFDGFGLVITDGQKSSGAGIRLTSATAFQSGANFSRLWFRFIPTGIRATECASISIRSCHFSFFAVSGVTVGNTTNPDIGDSGISDCQFFNGNYGFYGINGAGIIHNSSGGLKVIGCKFNGGKYGYQCDVKGQTSDSIIVGNSFENHSVAGASFANTINTALVPVAWNNIVITGNQFALNQKMIVLDAISNGSGVSYWQNVVISGNIFHSWVDDVCIEAHSCDGCLISGNQFFGQTSGATCITAYADNRTTGKITGNHTTGMLYTAINNASWEEDMYEQTGTVSGTTVNGFGNVWFVNPTAVTFSKAYKTAPSIQITVTGNSGISAITGSISASGFQAGLIGPANSSVVSAAWVARGVLP